MLDGFLRSLREDRLESLIRQALDFPETQRVRATKAVADSLCGLVEAIWDVMTLAAEAGSLLQVRGRAVFGCDRARPRRVGREAPPFFRVTEYGLGDRAQGHVLPPRPRGGDRASGTAQRFWQASAIHGYAPGLPSRGQLSTTKMFAEDATQGFAFIDSLRKSFDVVLMNPPFGEKPPPLEQYIKTHYEDAKNDIYAAFVLRGC